ncbi:MAG: class II aldolase/adducin family protein [Candidatus Stygibacter frigidus]|nr:class II aldolase/adducin family protein [Candidatus Stygibacter frigidus]
MGNEYQGTKFQTELVEKEVISDFIEELQYWAALFARNNCAPAIPGGYGGNLSCRDADSFLITASGANLADLKPDQIVKVNKISLDDLTVWAEGYCLPSSETLLHAAIYKARPEIIAIFHGHYPVFEDNFAKLGIPITSEAADYGSIKLVNDVLEILGKEKFLLLRHHGFISLGKTCQDAGEQVINVCNQLNIKIF